MRYVSRYVLADDDGPGVAAVTVRAAGGPPPFTISQGAAGRGRAGHWAGACVWGARRQGSLSHPTPTLTRGTVTLEAVAVLA